MFNLIILAPDYCIFLLLIRFNFIFVEKLVTASPAPRNKYGCLVAPQGSPHVKLKLYPHVNSSKEKKTAWKCFK